LEQAAVRFFPVFFLDEIVLKFLSLRHLDPWLFRFTDRAPNCHCGRDNPTVAAYRLVLVNWRVVFVRPCLFNLTRRSTSFSINFYAVLECN
jgi:hypothetical protein